MAKGYEANRERQEQIASLGKQLGKRAGFRCEWCEGAVDLRPWDYRPVNEPSLESLALLCGRCRDLAGGVKGDPAELRSLTNAVWSDIPAVSEGVARVLVRCGEPWARQAVEESLIPEEVKREILR